MSSRHDYRRRERSWERDDRDKDRDRDRDRDRYSRRRSSRSRSRSPPRRGGTESRRSGMRHQPIRPFIPRTKIVIYSFFLMQTGVTMEGTGKTTGETRIRASPVAAMNETDGMPAGETERKTGAGMTGTGGKATRVGTQSVTMTRGAASGRYGWIPSPWTRGNRPHNRKVVAHTFPSLDVSKTDRYRCVYICSTFRSAIVNCYLSESNPYAS